jgi:hypothetical protein
VEAQVFTTTSIMLATRETTVSFLRTFYDDNF